MKTDEYEAITMEEVNEWGTGSFGSDYRLDYLLQIIIGAYDLDEARKDILTFRKKANP